MQQRLRLLHSERQRGWPLPDATRGLHRSRVRACPDRRHYNRLLRDLGAISARSRPPGHTASTSRADCRRPANPARRRSRKLALPRPLRATMADIMVRAGRHGTTRARATLHEAPPLAHARVGQVPRRASIRSRARSTNLQLRRRRGRRSCVQSTAADGCSCHPAQWSQCTTSAKRTETRGERSRWLIGGGVVTLQWLPDTNE